MVTDSTLNHRLNHYFVRRRSGTWRGLGSALCMREFRHAIPAPEFRDLQI
jgi:hypothetical protein